MTPAALAPHVPPSPMLRLAPFVLLAAAASAQPATLHATLDLRAPIAAGWLDPATETVGLRGGTAPLSWGATTAAQDPDGDGLYTLAVPFDGARRVELKVKVDGADNPNGGWQAGPNHVVVLDGDTALRLAWADRAEQAPGVVTGRVETIGGVGGAGLAARAVHVWLPPGYAETDRRYPVLYLHDGASVFGTEPGDEWAVDEAATALVAAGEVEPLIVVAVENTDRRVDEYTPTAQTWRQALPRRSPPTAGGPLGDLTGAYDAGPDSLVVAVRDGALVVDPPDAEAWLTLVPRDDGTFAVSGSDVALEFVRQPDGAVGSVVAGRPEAGGLGDAYGRLLTDVVKPLVDARYRTRPGAAHTGLGGSSLGGLVTVHLGTTRPDVFGRLWVASPSVWWADRAVLDAVAQAEPAPGQRVWVDVGTGEGRSMVADARRLAEVLVEAGRDPALVRYVEAQGAGHDVAAWRARAPDALRFLFPPE